jgi:hypothetical protein
MTAFSQPERRGLERMQVVKSELHPDADLLTAFAEHSLTSREQEQVLAHLAVCGQCRDVVALAGSPLVEPVPEPARRRGIWEMPLFHWGAVAATVAVVVAAVSLGTHQSSKSPTQALLKETLPPAATVEGDKVAAEPQAKLDQPSANKLGKALADEPGAATTARRAVHLQENIRYERVPDQESKGAASSPVGGPVLAGNANAKLSTPQKVATAAVPPPPPPPAASGGVVARDQDAFSRKEAVASASKDQRFDLKKAPAAAPTVQGQNEPSDNTAYGYKADETLSVTAQDGVSQMNSAVVPQTAEAQSKNSMMAKPKEEAGRARSMPTTAFHQVRPIDSPLTGTEWQITNLGQLQRSFNRGGLWENMLSDRNFLSVAVVRDHIWAGGEKGLLYFSADNGRTWSLLSVRSGNTSITGNIVRMRFDDDTHGTIETSTGETWATSDGGQTWKKQ